MLTGLLISQVGLEGMCHGTINLHQDGNEAWPTHNATWHVERSWNNL